MKGFWLVLFVKITKTRFVSNYITIVQLKINLKAEIERCNIPVGLMSSEMVKNSYCSCRFLSTLKEVKKFLEILENFEFWPTSTSGRVLRPATFVGRFKGSCSLPDCCHWIKIKKVAINYFLRFYINRIKKVELETFNLFTQG